MKKPTVLLLLFLAVSLRVNAQTKQVAGIFPTIDHSGEISKKLEYSFYYFGALPLVNLKKPDFGNDDALLLFYAEQALTYKFSPKFSVTGSYVYQRENALNENFVNENRIHIQATYKHKLQNLDLKHRVRLDNRFVQNRVTKETPYTHRLRYLLGVELPLGDKTYFTAYEEAFFNTFKGASAVYGENWAYAAVGWKINDQHKIETGPLYIIWNTGTNSWFHQYYWQFTWISHVNFNQ